MGEQRMKAVQYSTCGGGASDLEHVSIPIPMPRNRAFLVRIEAASVNPLDWKINEGIFRPCLPRLPCIPGTDIAGDVISVGKDVQGFAPGDKVVCHLDVQTGGSLAEYAVASPESSAKRPPGVSAVEGACLPVAGLTALQCLTNSGVKKDGSYSGNVLITAAAGGVGLYAVQLAKLFGAHVTATVGKRNIELIRSLGADEVLDYKTPQGAKLASPSGKKYDVVINASGATWATVQPQLSPTGHVQDLNPNFRGILSALLKTWTKQKLSMMFMSAKPNDLTFLFDLVAAGKLKTFVDSKFPLKNAKDAWAKSKDGHATGKVVVMMGDQ